MCADTSTQFKVFKRKKIIHKNMTDIVMTHK